VNKVDITLKRLKEVDLFVLGGPKQPFRDVELQDIRKYIDEGGRVMIMM
jgi:hypothetical protein